MIPQADSAETDEKTFQANPKFFRFASTRPVTKGTESTETFLFFDMKDTNEFMTLTDYDGKPYISFNSSVITHKVVKPLNASEVGINYCTFLSESLELSRHATGRYSTDLTERDDIFIAALSVLLILVIEGILTSLLLRTNRGKVDSFAFSVKYFIDLARGLKPSHLMRSKRHRKQGNRRKLDIKLLLFAGAILSFTFGLEVLILLLSTPELRDVYNTDNAFQLKEVETPDWNQVVRNIESAVSKSCSAIELSMTGIEQGMTQISACVSVALPTPRYASSVNSFDESKEEAEMTIETHTHVFGSDHNITIRKSSDTVKAQYILRAYYTLDDGYIRMMTKRRFMFNFERRYEMLHKQYLAFLFSMYTRKNVIDTTMNIQRLRNLNISFTTGYGPVINIVQLQHRQRFRQVTSVNHTTRVKGIIPTGTGAFLFAQAVFKGAYGLGLGGPDRYDLLLGTGQTPPRPTVVWRETGRTLNWVSLTLSLLVASGTLVGFRFLLNRPELRRLPFYMFQAQLGAQQAIHSTYQKKTRSALNYRIGRMEVK